jgi:3'-5' exoribonuclease
MGVKDWQNGETIWGELVAVRDLQLRLPEAKRPQFTITVFDATGARAAISWGLSSEQIEQITKTVQQTPPLLRVSGTVDRSERYAGQLKIIGVMPATPVDMAKVTDQEFLEPLPLDHAQLVRGMDHLIRQVKQLHLAALLFRTIGPGGDLRTGFIHASAAKRNHHAYPGGLLRHSLEVTELALAATHHFVQVNRDLLITAGLLHDVGKLFEMNHAWQRGVYTDAGELLGHIYLGAERVSTVCCNLRFPESLRLALIHAILAHHDECEFGSPVQPKTAEAITLAKCDQISAELDAFFQAKKEASSHQRTLWKGDRCLFLGNLEPDGPLASDGPQHPPVEDPEYRLLRRLSEC